MTAREYVSGGVASLGWIAVIAGLALWASVGAMVPVSWAGLVGATLLALALLVVGGLRDAVRAAGQPRLAGWTHAVTALLALLAAVAFVGLPQAEIGRIPAAAVAAGGALLCALAARYPRPRNRERHAPEADPSPATHRGGPDSPEEWLGRLAGLLEGRHDLPRSQAAELVEEARSHLAATRRAPAAEFGPVEEYALRLAEPVPVRHSPWWRRPTVQAAVLTAAGGYWLVENLLVHGPAWRTALAAGVVLASGGPLVGWRPR
jgi:hypothetical protein